MSDTQKQTIRVKIGQNNHILMNPRRNFAYHDGDFCQYSTCGGALLRLRPYLDNCSSRH